MLVNSFTQALDCQWQILTGNSTLTRAIMSAGNNQPVEIEIGNVDANRKILSAEVSAAPSQFSFAGTFPFRQGITVHDVRLELNATSDKFLLKFSVDIEGSAHLASVSYTALICTAKI